jgi:hypothetical protein
VSLLHASPVGLTSSSLFFCEGFFQDRISQTIFLGWLWTAIVLIHASWVTRITGVNHWHRANFLLHRDGLPRKYLFLKILFSLLPI